MTEFGINLAEKNKRADKENPEDLNFTSKLPAWRVVKEADFIAYNRNDGNNNITRTTIKHNLGYIPHAIVYLECGPTGDIDFPIYNGTFMADLPFFNTDVPFLIDSDYDFWRGSGTKTYIADYKITATDLKIYISPHESSDDWGPDSDGRKIPFKGHYILMSNRLE